LYTVLGLYVVLKKKLAETARALRGWSKPLFSNARLQLHIANEVIFRLDISQEKTAFKRRDDLETRPQSQAVGFGSIGKK
jgi:hypothetical protein